MVCDNFYIGGLHRLHDQDTHLPDYGLVFSILSLPGDQYRAPRQHPQQEEHGSENFGLQDHQLFLQEDWQLNLLPEHSACSAIHRSILQRPWGFIGL